MWEALRASFHGVNWSAVYFTSRVLFWSFTSGTVLWCGVMLGLNAVEKVSMRSDLKSYAEIWLKWRMRSAKVRRLVNRWTPRLGMLFLGYVVGQAQLFNPVRELHQVEVLEKIDSAPDRFLVMIPKKPVNSSYNSDAQEKWKICPQGDQMPWKAGVILTVVQFRQGKDCQLFDRDTEVTYYQNSEHRVIDRQGKILYAKTEE